MTEEEERELTTLYGGSTAFAGATATSYGGTAGAKAAATSYGGFAQSLASAVSYFIPHPWRRSLHVRSRDGWFPHFYLCCLSREPASHINTLAALFVQEERVLTTLAPGGSTAFAGATATSYGGSAAALASATSFGGFAQSLASAVSFFANPHQWRRSLAVVSSRNNRFAHPAAFVLNSEAASHVALFAFRRSEN